MTMDSSDPGLHEALAPYAEAIKDFLSGRISFDQFEDQFLETFGGPSRGIGDSSMSRLMQFAVLVDSCVEDPVERDPGFAEIGPDELREAAEALLRDSGYIE